MKTTRRRHLVCLPSSFVLCVLCGACVTARPGKGLGLLCALICHTFDFNRMILAGIRIMACDKTDIASLPRAAVVRQTGGLVSFSTSSIMFQFDPQFDR